MKQTRISIRFSQPNYQKLVRLCNLYRLRFNQNTSINKLVNSCVRHEIIIKSLPPKIVNKINNRFTDAHYKQLFYEEIKVRNQINYIRRDISGGFNNLNQIAHHNNSLNIEQAKAYMNSIPISMQALVDISKQLEKCSEQLAKLSREVNKHAE